MEHKFRETVTNLADFHELFRCKLKKNETDNRSAAQIRVIKQNTITEETSKNYYNNLSKGFLSLVIIFLLNSGFAPKLKSKPTSILVAFK